MIQKKVLPFAKKHNLFTKGSKVYIAVSGGPDSLALLHFFSSIRHEYQLDLTAVSVDHQLRQDESQQDLKFVKQICQLWNIDFIGTSLNVPAYKEKTRMGTQAAARELRYQFFEQVMKKSKTKSPLLAMGHHGDDQVETMFMRLMRGTKPGGIPVKRPFAGGWIIRPFLCLTKKEIQAYCDTEGLTPRLDPSNLSPVYTRNAFRLNVLPFLKKHNPAIHENLQKVSEGLQEDEAYLFHEAQKIVEKTVIFRMDPREAEVNLKHFKDCPRPLQRRAFHLILNYLYRKPEDEITSVHLEQIFDVMDSQNPNSTLYFPNHLLVHKSYEELLFSFKKPDGSLPPVTISPGEEAVLPNGWKILAKAIKQRERPPEFSEKEFVCSMESVSLPLTIRSRQSGDRMNIRGLNGSKKIKDIFIDEKVPRYIRDTWPVVTDQTGKILWLAGLKKGEVTDTEASEWLKIIVEKSDEK